MADILITGGAGFIGSQLARRFAERGDKVHIITRPTSALDRLDGLAQGSLIAHPLDLSDKISVAACLKSVNPRHVFHLASMTRPPQGANPFDVSRAFEQDVLNLLFFIEALSELPQPPASFVRAGTLAEYGAAPVPYREDVREQPLTAYGASMVSGTHHLSALKKHIPFPFVSARLALIYGPRQSTQFLIPLMIERCLARAPITIRNPNERRDLLYIDDVVDGLARLSDAMPLEAEIINLCTGEAPTMCEVAAFVVEATGADPALIQSGNAPVEGGASYLLGSPDRAQSILEWRAETTLRQGIQKTVAFARNHSSTLKAAQ